MSINAYNDWRAGATYTHEHFPASAQSDKFVGHVPAQLYEAAEKTMLAAVPLLVELVGLLADKRKCRYDHGGLCQTHRLDPRPCPNEVARMVIGTWT